MDVELQDHFGRRLSELLQQRRITQRELAQHLQCNPAAVNHWCSGKNLPTLDNVYKICSYLGVSIDNITGVWDRSNKSIVWKVLPTTVESDYARRILEIGVKMFELLLVDSKTMIECQNFLGNRIEFLRIAMKYVLAQRAIVISSLMRAPGIEKDIAMKYGLNSNSVVVGDIDGSIDGALLRSELVATLAVQNIQFGLFNAEIAFTGGYETERFIKLLPPVIHEISVALVQELGPTINHHEPNLPSSCLLTNKFIVSRIEYMTEINYQRLTSLIATITECDESTPAIVGNLGRHWQSERPIDRKQETFRLRVLGLKFDLDGHLMNAPSSSDITLLQAVSKNASVWLIASRGYKAKVVDFLLRNGIINSLVIDKEIAMNLLK